MRSCPFPRRLVVGVGRGDFLVPVDLWLISLPLVRSYDTPTDERLCINSVSIRFNPDSDLKYEGPSKKK